MFALVIRHSRIREVLAEIKR